MFLIMTIKINIHHLENEDLTIRINKTFPIEILKSKTKMISIVRTSSFLSTSLRRIQGESREHLVSRASVDLLSPDRSIN